ncbi:hypothetical protein [Paractinoplanes durhamensis]|uniref:hypothetical protein n=1 Tax=Paractinoplanes durhamensis TaxID=113563 RepID=UPI003642007E
MADPRRWLLERAEPAARWVTLTAVLNRPADDPEVTAAHRAVVADAPTRALLDRIPDWTAGDKLGGHDSPGFAPNLLMMLFDHGVTPGDDPRIGRLLDQMLDHRDCEGRFESYAARRASEAPVWGRCSVTATRFSTSSSVPAEPLTRTSRPVCDASPLT